MKQDKIFGVRWWCSIRWVLCLLRYLLCGHSAVLGQQHLERTHWLGLHGALHFSDQAAFTANRAVAQPHYPIAHFQWEGNASLSWGVQYFFRRERTEFLVGLQYQRSGQQNFRYPPKYQIALSNDSLIDSRTLYQRSSFKAQYLGLRLGLSQHFSPRGRWDFGYQATVALWQPLARSMVSYQRESRGPGQFIEDDWLAESPALLVLLQLGPSLRLYQSRHRRAYFYALPFVRLQNTPATGSNADWDFLENGDRLRRQNGPGLHWGLEIGYNFSLKP